MARKYKELRDRMTPEARARAKERADRELLAMNLKELRQKVGGMTQANVADLLGVTQAAVSQLEKREDMLIQNLAEYVKALGGRLELVARFEDQPEVRITNFEGVKGQIVGARS